MARIAAASMMARPGHGVKIVAGPGAPLIAVVRRDSLFRDRYASFDGTNPDYDVHPDGRRFVFLDHAAEIRVEVVVNWRTELRAKLAAAKRE